MQMFLEHVLLKHSDVPVPYARRLELVSLINCCHFTLIDIKLPPLIFFLALLFCHSLKEHCFFSTTFMISITSYYETIVLLTGKV